MSNTLYRITSECICRYAVYLREQERAAQGALVEWKEQLTAAYAPATVNSMLTAANGFFAFMGWRDLSLRLLKIQKTIFCDESRELTRAEYIRLVEAAGGEGNQRLSLVLQTICATGIRVSELRFITAEAVSVGRAEIFNKGKRRVVFLPDKLQRLLKKYLREQKKTAGAVFTTRTGKPLDRSNIWRDMKKLCESANVEPGKVFPHNLRHLSPGRTTLWKRICPGWRTFWAIPASTPPAFTPWRAEPSTPSRLPDWALS